MAGSGIVVAVPTTAGAGVALEEAVRLAGAEGATLHLVAAYRPASTAERERARRRLPAGLRLDYDDDRLIEARDAAEDARETLPAGLAVRVHVERGDLDDALCRVARCEDARLILSTRTARPRFARHSAGARLAGLAPCPVRLVDLTAADSVRPAPSALVDPAESPALG